MAALNRQYEKLRPADGKPLSTVPEADRLWDEMDKARASLSHVIARSHVGAAFQVLEIYCVVGLPEDVEEKMTRADVRAVLDAECQYRRIGLSAYRVMSKGLNDPDLQEMERHVLGPTPDDRIECFLNSGFDLLAAL
jgi:hypothetical protein